MPDTTPCSNCGRKGWVRFERIIRGDDHQRLYYCGACDHTWTVSDTGKASQSEKSVEGRPGRSRRSK